MRMGTESHVAGPAFYDISKEKLRSEMNATI